MDVNSVLRSKHWITELLERLDKFSGASISDRREVVLEWMNECEDFADEMNSESAEESQEGRKEE